MRFFLHLIAMLALGADVSAGFARMRPAIGHIGRGSGVFHPSKLAWRRIEAVRAGPCCGAQLCDFGLKLQQK